MLGRIAEERLGFARALPELKLLAVDTGESVNLGILTATDVLVVLDVPSGRAVAAIAVQAPALRLPDGRLHEVAERIARAAVAVAPLLAATLR